MENVDVNVTRIPRKSGADQRRKAMSNLYMTTEEFAAMVVDILDEQNYFKKGEKAHPGDICVSFSTVAETIGKSMEWAIKREGAYRKQAMMESKDLRK
jgi:uncharacterized short protein YbdD (DUF466 family)